MLERAYRMMRTVFSGRNLYLTVCMANVAVSTAAFGLYAYVNVFKAMFKMTQFQVSVVLPSALSWFESLGFLMSILLYEKVGVLAGACVNMIVTTLSWMFIHYATLQPDWFVDKTYILAGLFALAGHGGIYSCFLGAVNSYLVVKKEQRLPSRFLASVIGDLGFFAFVLIYVLWFDKGDPENKSIIAYFVVIVCIVFVIGFVSIFILPINKYHRLKFIDLDSQDEGKLSKESNSSLSKRDLPGKCHPESGDYEILENDCGEQDKKTRREENREWGEIRKGSDKTNPNGRPTTVTVSKSPGLLQSQMKQNTREDDLDCKFSIPCLLIVSAYTIPMATIAFNNYNMTFITDSLGVARLNSSLIICARVAVLLGNLSTHPFYTCWKKCGQVDEKLLVVCNISMIMAQVLLLTAFRNTTVLLYLAYIITGFVIGVLSGIGPIPGLLSYNDHIKDYWLVFFTIPAYFILLQVGFALFYEAEIPPGGGTYCHGEMCTKNSLIITIVGLVLSCVSSLAFWLYTRRYNSKDSTICGYEIIKNTGH